MNLPPRSILRFQYLRLFLACLALPLFIWVIKSKALFASWSWIPLLGMIFSGVVFLYIRKKFSLSFLLWSELILDMFLSTIIVWGTGGRESSFVFLYPLLIFVGTLHLGKRGADFLTLLSLVAYLFIWIQPPFPSLGSLPLLHFFLGLGAMGVSGILALRFAEEIARREKRAAETQAALYRIEELYQHIMRSLASGLLILDLEGVITSSNKKAREILPFSPLEGRKITEILPGIDFKNMKHRGETVLELSEKRYLGYSLFPLKDEKGEIFGYGFLFQDITHVKDQEQKLRQAEHLAALGTMAAGLVHEIKNPLASISGAIQLLKEGLGNIPQARKLLDILERESDRLDALVTNFLFFAKPTKGEMQEVNLYHICKEVLEEVAFSPEFKRIQVKLKIPRDIYIKVEPMRFKQILLNLFLNSSQALKEQSSPRLELGFTLHNKKGILSIRDNGEGIPPEILPRIFEPFFTTKSKGTGLGLSMVYSLLKAWGGSIEVDSIPSQGTCFRIIFPPSLIFYRH